MGMSEFLPLERFAKVLRLPCQIEMPKTLFERIRSYLPWSWDSNHKTKWVHDPLAPKFLKFRRSIPFTND